MSQDAQSNKHATYELASGREVRLLGIDQFRTYEGLLIGVPTREMNQERMDALRAFYIQPGEYGVPLLFEAEQVPVRTPQSLPGLGTPAKLPSITCVARFISDGLEGSDKTWSVLRVIWFQDDFAFPIEDRVLQQIAEIDWEAHATPWKP